MMFLLGLSQSQLERLYRKAYARMSQYDGYQPFGYDWITIKYTKPGWYRALREINSALRTVASQPGRDAAQEQKGK